MEARVGRVLARDGEPADGDLGDQVAVRGRERALTASHEEGEAAEDTKGAVWAKSHAHRMPDALCGDNAAQKVLIAPIGCVWPAPPPMGTP